MTGVSLTIGLSNSDRTRPIAHGELPVAGVDAKVTLMGVQALFNHQLTTHEFDCCEFPIATYLRSLERPERPYLAIPIFPSRHFRLSDVFVHTGKGITKPADLAGKRIGVSVFDMAAAVWLRGIFEEYYDLPRTAPIYVAGGLETLRSGDEHPQYYPPQFQCEERLDRSLSALLAAGEIDAIYTARAPSCWPSATVTRLFDDPIPEELGYFARTGIYPAMHVLAIKRPIAEANPGIVRALYDAFVQGQGIARERLFDSAALSTMLPWQLEALLFAEKKLGPGYWAHGLAANRAMLETVIRYLLEDGLIATPYTPEDLFSADMHGT
jgi:4,5-dihydroxyphthalate decarboxylase